MSKRNIGKRTRESVRVDRDSDVMRDSWVIELDMSAIAQAERARVALAEYRAGIASGSIVRKPIARYGAVCPACGLVRSVSGLCYCNS